VLDNSITGMTGHQNNPANGLTIKGDPTLAVNLEALAAACGYQRVRVIDPYDLAASEKVIKEELAAAEPSLIISRRPCMLLKTTPHRPALKVNPDQCIGCKSCMRVGCPAISMKNGKAVIDFTQCMGCGFCKQLCPKKAIGLPEGE
ncbi:MAG: 4Fe-4S binding protein, partial [Firmicutes bacterium]|nr:4Fe-4S binding protein [Bacillota bacterium]